jgi:hypothetical protein
MISVDSGKEVVKNHDPLSNMISILWMCASSALKVNTYILKVCFFFYYSWAWIVTTHSMVAVVTNDSEVLVCSKIIPFCCRNSVPVNPCRIP